MPEAHPPLETWCPATKKEGIAGSGAPRRPGGRPIWPQRRGARRRRNKGLRGAEHHAGLAVGPFDPKDVVPGDEGTRDCGDRSTTPARRAAHPTPKAWCPTTKKQGFAGSKAPRAPGGQPIRPQRRGAPRRRNKGSRGVKHHAHPAVSPSEPRDVVPRDEGTRVSGERSTTSAQPEAPPLGQSPRTPGGRPPGRK